ncbi:MAG: type IV toxin-antitoxin system AbiEi family antitoxin domain-containing protein [Eubacteriales bacterium]|nr:type IV toxin-antitoxin system AbiEi family antitoxin domain-containing protein [Eubacteriales bacterium]
MDKMEVIKNIIINNDGIAKTTDFVAEGLSNYDVANLCKEGYIERVRHGYYQLAGQEDIKEEQMLAALLPESIVCVESALFYYGYSNFTPRQWSIAVPRTFSRTRLNIGTLATRVYFIQPALFEIGKTSGEFNGVQLAVYDRERTICDCFKYRTKLDNEMFNKALNAYATDKRKNLSNLSGYAKKMKVYKKLMDVMEVILNA